MSSYIVTGVGATSGWATNSISFRTEGGTVVGMERKEKEGVNPALFFRFVKSKLQRNEQENLRKKLKKLQAIVSKTEELGQKALHEKLLEAIAITVRELECTAVGCGNWVSESVIQKFHKVYKPEGEKVMRFETWEKFPRIPPKHVADKIKKIKSMNLFDEYHVLYLDYTGEKLKTNKDKIIEKDPILFGKFAYAPDRYYYIIDWVDEYCDLTFEKFVSALPDEENIENQSPELTPEYFDKIKKEVMERHERLKATNSSNFRTLAAQEDKKVEPVVQKKPWWNFWS